MKLKSKLNENENENENGRMKDRIESNRIEWNVNIRCSCAESNFIHFPVKYLQHFFHENLDIVFFACISFSFLLIYSI